MITQRRYVAVLVLSGASIAIPSTAQAGPMFDWLFHRNRSQSLADTTTANYGTANTTAGYNPGAAMAAPVPARGCCLFGGRRNVPANAATAAAQNNVYGTTAGYAPQGGCSSGWCQQTVVRWIPQTAYRTAYQPVPVTTYKTSTTINPANGLPLTCTRPCTSYTMQARRVPYTAYRPVYTTVPVADTMGGPQQSSAAGIAAGYPAAPPAPNYALQAPPATPGGCASCQTGGAATGYGNWSNVPGYTPGNATSLPPAAAGTPWSSTPLAGPPANAPGATPWSSVDPNAGYGSWPPSATPLQSAPNQNPAAGATEWQPVGPNGTTQPPPGQGSTPADAQPRLRPEIPEEYSWSTYQSQKSAPIPEHIRGKINSGAKSTFIPRESAEEPDTSYWNHDRSQSNSHASDQDSYRKPLPPEGLFRTPRNNGYTPPPSFPDLSPPSNTSNDIGGTENNEADSYRGGIRDLDRVSPPSQSWQNFDDKTAGQRRPSGTMPLIEETTQTRYAATPIQWATPKKQVQRPSTNDWRKDADRWRNESRRRTDWTPIR